MVVFGGDQLLELSNVNQLYDDKVTVRSLLYIFPNIKCKLQTNDNRNRLFRNSIIGHCLDIPSHANDNHLLNNVLQHQVYVLIARQFFITLVIINCILYVPSLVYLLVFNVEKCILKIVIIVLFMTVSFQPKGKKIKECKGRWAFESSTDEKLWSELSDEDALRVCLLMAAKNVFMGRKLRLSIPNHILSLVEDFFCLECLSMGWVYAEPSVLIDVLVVTPKFYKPIDSVPNRCNVL